MRVDAEQSCVHLCDCNNPYVLLASVSEHKPSLKVTVAECSSGLRSTACYRCMSVCEKCGSKRKKVTRVIEKTFFGGLRVPSSTN